MVFRCGCLWFETCFKTGCASKEYNIAENSLFVRLPFEKDGLVLRSFHSSVVHISWFFLCLTPNA
jgi:phosphate starvation-inducible membrane PsiE